MAVAWVLALGLHVALLVLLDARLATPVPAKPAQAIELVLVRAAEPVLPPRRRSTTEVPSAAPLQPPLPTPAAMPPLPLLREAPVVAAADPPPRVDVVAPVRSPPSAAPAEAPPVAARPRERIVLFEPDGRLRVAEAVLEGKPPSVADYIPVPRELAPWEQRIDPLVYEASALEPIWKPDQESLLDEVARRATVTKTFRTPWGTKVTCSWVLLIGGCGW